MNHRNKTSYPLLGRTSVAWIESRRPARSCQRRRFARSPCHQGEMALEHLRFRNDRTAGHAEWISPKSTYYANSPRTLLALARNHLTIRDCSIRTVVGRAYKD